MLSRAEETHDNAALYHLLGYVFATDRSLPYIVN